MPTSPTDLDARLAATGPRDTVRGLNLHALLALAAGRLGEARAEQLRQLLPQPLPADYEACPAADFLRLLYATAEALAPLEGSFPEALMACGRAFTERLFGVSTGLTLLRIVGGGNPHRLLAAVPATANVFVGFGKLSYRRLGDDAGVLQHLDDKAPPEFFAGVLQRGLEKLGLEVRATPRALSLTDHEVELEWRKRST